jgi:hypothetical protein
MRKIMPKPKKRSVPSVKKESGLKMAKGGRVKVRGTGAATKGLYASGPMA